jgi:RNA polymerase sigma-70 factor, ECF subfamily
VGAEVPESFSVSAAEQQAGSGARSLATSTSLLQGLKAQQSEAWVCFVRLYGPLLYTWCRKRGLSAEDARDIVQEVCRAVHRHIGDFHHATPGSFRAWLWTITRNRIVDLRKKRHTPAVGGSDHQQAMQQFPFQPDASADEEAEPTDENDRLALVHRALDLIRAEFEPRTWQAFWRSAVEEHDTRHIADDLKITPATVRQAKSRILRRLRTILADLGEEPA